MLHSLPAFSHFPRYPQAKWALLVPIPGWVGLCTFWDPMGLSNELSPVRLGVSPAVASNPKGFSISGSRLYFPVLEPWGCVVCFTLPLILLVYLHVNVGSASRSLPPLLHIPWPHWVLQPLPCLGGSPLSHAAHLCPSYHSG